jgi:hypothetical protein
VPEQSATALHAALKAALARLRAAEADAVGCFAEILRRKLYRERGYSSIHAYAEAELGFSANKTWQFIRLAEALESLPAVKASVASGELSWTKARTLARVATPRSEAAWLRTATSGSNRELELAVKMARGAKSTAAQPELLAAEPGPSLPAPPVQVSFTLSAEQHALLEAMLESLRKAGDQRPRAELLLEAFAALAAASTDGETATDSVALSRGKAKAARKLAAPPYQIVIYRCAACGGAKLPDGRPLAPAAAAAAACDARELRPGQPNRASIPPAMRRAVLARDGHRCAAPGCRNTHFLEVHHRRPRELGGSNAAENLVTLCGACHRLAHEQGNVLRL